MNVIGPFPLYAILNPIYSQILHVRSIWNLFKIFTVSLSAEEIANGMLKLILSKFSVLPLKSFHIPWWIFNSPTILHDLHYIVRGWHMSREGERAGARSSQIFGRTVFHRVYKYPSPLPHFIYSAWPLSPARAPQTLAPPLLHRRRWGRASLPRPRRRRTHADRGNLHSAAAVAVFLRRVRARKI